MRTFWKTLAFSAITLFCSFAYGQKDTLFWFAAPEVSASIGDSPIYLRMMSYSSPASITVSMPANGGFTPINVNLAAYSLDSINLTPYLAQIEIPAGNSVSNTGLKVESDSLISVIYELKATSNKELFSLKGNKALGTNFYTPFQKFWDNGVTAPASFSSIDIVATEDNTTVLITPRTAVTGHAQDVTYAITLNTGQTYSARDMDVNASTSLAGSIVSSDKQIALTLFSGALSESGCLSAVGDQITSADYAGRDFIVHKGTGGNDRMYVMATQNGTNLTITNSGTVSTVINWGETYEVALSDVFNYVSANKPVYVWHVSGYGCELSGTQVPNLYCSGTYETAFTRTTSDSLGLILYTRTGFEDDFTLNGSAALIPPGAFSDVPGTGGDFKVATIYFNTVDVPVNSYNLVDNSGDIFGMGVMNGNSGSGSSYTYLSEFNSYPFVDAGSHDTICANTTLSLNGLVGGGDVTGVWSTTGFGAFSSANDVLLNGYVPSPLDSIISPIKLILTSTGNCPVKKDTLILGIEPAPIVSASADQTVCENNAVIALSGSVSGGSTTGMWSTVGGTGTFAPDNTTLDADYVPSVADIAGGSLELVLTSTNFGSCLAERDTMEITFTTSATVDAGADTIYTCQNNPNANLSGSVSGVTTTGKWISSGTGVFSPDNLTLNATYQPSPQDVGGGSVWLYLESTSNGDCIPVRDSLHLIFTPSPAVDAGTNTIACNNDAEVILAGNVSGGATTGVWSGGSGTYTPSNTELNATYVPSAGELTAGNVFLTLTSTNNNGCLAVNDVVQINYVAPPFANFNYTEECLYEGAVFTDFSLPGYGNISGWEWDFGDASTSTSQNNSHFYSAAGTYDVQLVVTSTVGCTDTISNQVEAYEIPVAGFTFASDCPNNQIVVDFTDQSSTVSDAINYWHYDFGGQGTQLVQNPSQTFNPNATYTITQIVGTVNGCYDTISQVLSVPSVPVASFGYSSSNGLNIGAIFDFVDNSTNATSYLWDLGDNSTTTEQNPTNTYFANGSYTVILYVTGALGCTDSTFQEITINTVTTEIVQLIPNAISPNNDNKNDVWKLEFLDILFPNAHVEVFNEWGQKIFESDGYDIPWDGKYNNELVPDGTYYYVIDLKDAGDETDIYKGTILVLKSRE